MRKVLIILMVILSLSCSQKKEEISAKSKDIFCVTTADNVMLYSEKNTNSKILATIPKDVKVKFIQSENENDMFIDLDLPEFKKSIIYWVTIEFNNVIGYVDSINIYPIEYSKEYKDIILLEDNMYDKYGLIQGLVQYPSEGIPLNMIIGAEEINKKILYVSKDFYAKFKSGDSKYRCYYKLNLPEGEYRVFYNLPIGNNQSFENNFKMYYTGFESNYNNEHEPVVIKLKVGDKIKNINPSI